METIWTVDDVAYYLRVPVQTLYDWRSRGYGPPARRMGKFLRYKASEVMAWFERLDNAA